MTPKKEERKVMTLRPFHLAIPVSDIPKAREFYGTKLGFDEGRSDDHWIDYNFFGHQLVCHVGEVNSFSNEVDGKEVPVVKCEAEIILRNTKTNYEYNSDQEAEDDIANPETDTVYEDVTRSVKIKVADMPPLGAGSDE